MTNEINRIKRSVSLAIAVVSACTASIASAQYSFTRLAAFNGANGASPQGDLIADASGNLYGTTYSGGNSSPQGGSGFGAVFEVAAGTHALTDLALFSGTTGFNPYAGLISNVNGNLYGTTFVGGPGSRGTVFKVAAGTHALSSLAAFNLTNGANPISTLIADPLGNLYGTTATGGASGAGNVFEVVAGSNVPTTLVNFNGVNGGSPSAGLIADAGGNLYGTTASGGANGAGTVFEVAAGAHVLTTLASFNGTNGATPYSRLLADTSGNLYGTTYEGGSSNLGTVFRLAAGTHALSTLAEFDGTNGSYPYAALIADASGNLYGTTYEGGANESGTVFKIAANTHALTTLFSFDASTAIGGFPYGGVLADANGNLYGTTVNGGPGNFGTVFELSPVPEPTTLNLAGCGLAIAALIGIHRRHGKLKLASGLGKRSLKSNVHRNAQRGVAATNAIQTEDRRGRKRSREFSRSRGFSATSAGSCFKFSCLKNKCFRVSYTERKAGRRVL